MCITRGSRLFVRSDDDPILQGILPDVSKTQVSPAAHMNYNGGSAYRNSGYLSLFEYIPGQRTMAYQRDTYVPAQAAAYAVCQMTTAYIHFIFIPAVVAQINISESNVHGIPDTGRTPTLLNTDQCSPPSRISEDGQVLERASRYINEYLYLGAWAQGTSVFTERRNSSAILQAMLRQESLESITKLCSERWPCPGPDDDFPPGPGPGRSMGAVF